MASWEIEDGRKKKILILSKYMSSTQYQLWYNQIFAGFLMNVDDFLGKTEISVGNTLKYATFWPYGDFKGTRWPQNVRE